MLTLLSALKYSLYKTKTYLSFRLDISHFSGSKTFHAILGTILSIPIDISCEIFIRFVKTWAGSNVLSILLQSRISKITGIKVGF